MKSVLQIIEDRACHLRLHLFSSFELYTAQ